MHTVRSFNLVELVKLPCNDIETILLHRHKSLTKDKLGGEQTDLHTCCFCCARHFVLLESYYVKFRNAALQFSNLQGC